MTPAEPPSPATIARRRAGYRRLLLAAGWLLVLLCLAWEWALAPLRPGGSLLILKVLPLLLLLPAMARGIRRAYQWTTLIILAYVCEAIVRATSEASPVRELALAELLLATAVYVLAIRWLRADGSSRKRRRREGPAS